MIIHNSTSSESNRAKHYNVPYVGANVSHHHGLQPTAMFIHNSASKNTQQSKISQLAAECAVYRQQGQQ
jgi:hypothetical protein